MLGVVEIRGQVPGLRSVRSSVPGLRPDTVLRSTEAAALFESRGPNAESRSPHDFRHLTRAENRVDLGNLLTQFVAIALRQAAGHDQSLTRAGLLVLRHLEDGVDRLLLRLVDERAGVDDEHVGVGGIAGQLMPLFLGEPEHDLGVNEVLGAAERDHSNLHACEGCGQRTTTLQGYRDPRLGG